MTAFWTEPDFDDHEMVHFVRDRESGLTAIIAVHPRISGRALVARGSGIIPIPRTGCAMRCACRAG